MMRTLDTPVLVVGTGIAGLKASLALADSYKVIVTTKRNVGVSSSDWAQGGISCVMDPGDSFEAHIEDTLSTGSGLCDEEAVQAIIEGGPNGIRELEKLGVAFERNGAHENDYDLGREGGHSHRRVLHAGDITGHEIISQLIRATLAHPNITLLERVMAIDLVTTGWLKHPGTNSCIGAYFLDERTREVFAVRARHTVLATGGACKVYQYTSNPDVATGDGIAMAWRAGLPVKNLEMVQFHPTALFHRKAKSFLISEAIRGEGGVLLNHQGERFVENLIRVNRWLRGYVAGRSTTPIKQTGAHCVYLDITHKSEAFLREGSRIFISAVWNLESIWPRNRIPVVPAAHYFCGEWRRR